jgi:NAD(P)-dependent dehydrogenase (short-subunit alcohol dehydrogenase family)
LLLTSNGVPEVLAAWCASAIADHGAEVDTLTVAQHADRGDVAAQLASATGPVDGVLSLVGTDETGGLASTLIIVQALGDAGVAAPLWCLTQGAVTTAASDEAVSAAQAQGWGLARVLGLEEPERWGGLVDLPEILDDWVAEALCVVLAADEGEDQVALRPDRVLGRRLVRATSGEKVGTPWVPRGTALVTGGTGALGAHVAHWLAAAGIEHVILASRRGPDAPGADALVADLRALGAKVTVAACDVADRVALSDLLDGIPPEHPLRTIVHAAGVGVSGDLSELSVEDLADAAAAKATGALHLHELTADHDLDAFVLFSSGAAVWGGGGQGAYAAANAFVDALAEQRRAQGLKATSVAWGPWADGGMAQGDAGEQFRRRGVGQMAPPLALSSLQQALDQGETCLAVADLDWERFAPSFAAARRRPLIEDIPEVAEALATAAAPVPSTDTELVRRLAGLGEAECRQVLVEVLRSEVAAVLGHGGPAAVDPDRAFKDLGFDSVTAVELRNRLNEITGLSLAATVVFDHPTTGALGRELAARLTPGPQAASEEALAHLAKVEAALASGANTPDVRTAAQRLLSKLTSGNDSNDQTEADLAHRLETADDDELFAIIDQQLGDPTP